MHGPPGGAHVDGAAGLGGQEQQYRLEIVARVLYEGDCPGAEADVQGVLKDVSISWQ